MSVVGENFNQGREPSVGELLARLWRRRSIVMISMAVCVVLFAAVAFLMTPVYQGTTVLVPANPARAGTLGTTLGSLGSLASAAGLNVGPLAGNRTEEALAVLRSREFSESFIVDQQLMPKLFASRWNSSTNAWKVPFDEQPSLARGFKKFSKLRTAAEDKRTGLIKVTLQWPDPAEAAQLTNALVSRLNGVMRARAVERTDAYLGYLQRELAVTTAVETRQAIGRLMEEQINERMLANVTEEYAFRAVDRALAPDVDEPVRPRRLLLIMLGAITGLIVGVVAVLVFEPLRQDWANALVRGHEGAK